jgi:hypothetical protein
MTKSPKKIAKLQGSPQTKNKKSSAQYAYDFKTAPSRRHIAVDFANRFRSVRDIRDVHAIAELLRNPGNMREKHYE